MSWFSHETIAADLAVHSGWDVVLLWMEEGKRRH